MDAESIRKLVAGWVESGQKGSQKSSRRKEDQSGDAPVYEARPERLGLGAKPTKQAKTEEEQMREKRIDGRLLSRKKKLEILHGKKKTLRYRTWERSNAVANSDADEDEDEDEMEDNKLNSIQRKSGKRSRVKADLNTSSQDLKSGTMQTSTKNVEPRAKKPLKTKRSNISYEEMMQQFAAQREQKASKRRKKRKKKKKRT
eukprot:CAMPEP_0114510480 /NCGR_PEP_ID=MMETSP0109-20121206/13819_1 /TAXON_ID=29199 /ORGANISM="Chlorarachnion reptans, Strain CCCM449" /LENGTH=200 /DNA_ID=CAMNT_0001689809 /DNA_START=109 /DNA_END=707 /DNA_ORIENTATION=+